MKNSTAEQAPVASTRSYMSRNKNPERMQFLGLQIAGIIPAKKSRNGEQIPQKAKLVFTQQSPDGVYSNLAGVVPMSLALDLTRVGLEEQEEKLFEWKGGQRKMKPVPWSNVTVIKDQAGAFHIS